MAQAELHGERSYIVVALKAAENSSLVSGHDFKGCAKTQALHQGTTLKAAEKLMPFIRARL
jgi:hypothetical protein